VKIHLKGGIKVDTRELHDQVMALVKPSIDALLRKYAIRKHYHIVIMDPRKKPWEGSFEDAILAEFSQGMGDWEYDYKKFARSKAKQSWRNQQANIITQTLAPATLLSGDALYFGSFEYYGMIVACSGIESYFDMLISGWIALAYQQLSQHYIAKHKAAYPDEDFLP
jgi:hypothetical protein